METATHRLHRLTSYEPGRDWDAPADEPGVLQDLQVNDFDRLPWFVKRYPGGPASHPAAPGAAADGGGGRGRPGRDGRGQPGGAGPGLAGPVAVPVGRGGARHGTAVRGSPVPRGRVGRGPFPAGGLRRGAAGRLGRPDGLPSGVYRWPALDAPVRAGVLRDELYRVCLDQALARDAAFVASASGMTFLDSEVPALLGEHQDALLFTCVGAPLYQSSRGGPPGAPVTVRMIRPLG